MTSSNDIIIESSLRPTGTGVSKKMRRNKEVPCVIYGPKIKENFNIKISEKDATKYTTSQFLNQIIKLNSSDKAIDGLRVLVKTSTLDNIKGRTTHIDFFAADMKATVKVEVEVKYTGDCIGIKDGGVLNTVRNQIEVESLPGDIPESIEIDITNLEVGGSIHVSAATVPSNVKIITPGDLTLVTVAQIQEEPEAVEAAPVAAEGEAEAAPAGDGEAKDAAADADKKE